VPSSSNTFSIYSDESSSAGPPVSSLSASSNTFSIFTDADHPSVSAKPSSLKPTFPTYTTNKSSASALHSSSSSSSSSNTFSIYADEPSSPLNKKTPSFPIYTDPMSPTTSATTLPLSQTTPPVLLSSSPARPHPTSAISPGSPEQRFITSQLSRTTLISSPDPSVLDNQENRGPSPAYRLAPRSLVQSNDTDVLADISDGTRGIRLALSPLPEEYIVLDSTRSTPSPPEPPLSGRRIAAVPAILRSLDDWQGLPPPALASNSALPSALDFEIFCDATEPTPNNINEKESTDMTNTEIPLDVSSSGLVDPFSPREQERLLRCVRPALLRCLYEMEDVDESRAVAGALARFQHGKRRVAAIEVSLGSRTFLVERMIGKGAFASVYLAGDVDDANKPRSAIKMQAPPHPWELHICLQIQQRVPQSRRNTFLSTESMYMYPDRSFLVSAFSNETTLQDVVNAFVKVGKPMDETLVMYFAIEILKAAECLHANDIIHCDLKPDNFLLRFDNITPSGPWSAHGADGWSQLGVKLIDYGQGIDLRQYGPDVKFTGSTTTSSFTCFEMTKGLPWKYQADTFALCSTIHCLLHSTYMSVEESATVPVVLKPRTPLKRYYQADLWARLFHDLLNLHTFEKNEVITLLSSHREQLEGWLTKTKGKAAALRMAYFKLIDLLYQENE